VGCHRDVGGKLGWQAAGGGVGGRARGRHEVPGKVTEGEVSE
jgi:hypothetical protein